MGRDRQLHSGCACLDLQLVEAPIISFAMRMTGDSILLLERPGSITGSRPRIGEASCTPYAARRRQGGPGTVYLIGRHRLALTLRRWPDLPASSPPAFPIASASAASDHDADFAINTDRGYTANGLNQYGAVAGAGFGYDANGNPRLRGDRL